MAGRRKFSKPFKNQVVEEFLTGELTEVYFSSIRVKIESILNP